MSTPRPIKIESPKGTIVLRRGEPYWTLEGPSGRHSFLATGERADPLAHLAGYLRNNAVPLWDICRTVVRVALRWQPGYGCAPAQHWMTTGVFEAATRKGRHRSGATWAAGYDLGIRLRPFLG